MASVIIWYLDGQLGRNVFNNTTNEYYRKHKKYPTVLKELPEWLTKNGWPCTGASGHFMRPVGWQMKKTEARGLQFADEEALTAFILRWGGNVDH